MQERGTHDELLAHPVRIAFDEFIAPRRKFEQLEEFLAARPRRVLFQTVQVGDETEEFTATELLVEKRSVRDEANLPLGFLRGSLNVIPRDGRTASTGFEQADEEFDGGGFASAIGSQKPKKLTRLDVQVELFDRDEMAIALFQIDHGNHQRAPLGSCRLPGFTGWLPCWHKTQAVGA